MAKTPEDVLKLAEESGAQIVDFRFIDLPGVWQHFSIPATEFEAGMFTDGLGFDGSSIRGFQQIQESDMLLMPDPTTAYMDPLRTHSTLSIICNVEDPLTRQPYSRGPAPEETVFHISKRCLPVSLRFSSEKTVIAC